MDIQADYYYLNTVAVGDSVVFIRQAKCESSAVRKCNRTVYMIPKGARAIILGTDDTWFCGGHFFIIRMANDAKVVRGIPEFVIEKETANNAKP